MNLCSRQISCIFVGEPVKLIPAEDSDSEEDDDSYYEDENDEAAELHAVVPFRSSGGAGTGVD